jgi:hypothetical protein
MVVYLRLLGGTLLILLLSANGYAQIQGLTATVSDQGVFVSQGDRPVLFYQQVTKSMDGRMPRAGYVHPLYGLEGQTLTEDFPADHRHHRGVFWAWHQVWVGDQMLGDPWLCEGFQWDVESVKVKPRDNSIELNATVHWRSSQHVDEAGNPIAIVKEQTTIAVHPSHMSYRLVDFDISLLAQVGDVRIGGSDDDKGYGGFSPRIKLSSDQRFTAAAGELKPIRTAMDVGPWVDVSDRHWGLAMISHAQNPGSPQPWILRRRRSMQNAVYPGRDPVSLSTETPTRLRYRLVVHDGKIAAEMIDSLYKSFNSLP